MGERGKHETGSLAGTRRPRLEALLLLASSLALSSAACGSRSGPWPSPADDATWPDGAWAEARPADRGLDEEVLAAALADYARGASDPHEVLVIKDGFAVLRAARYPYPEGEPHAIFSCTKSIVSLLAGLSQGDGLPLGEDRPLEEWFPEARDSWPDLRIGHLLGMRTGMDWNEGGSYGQGDSYMAFLGSPDPAGYFFSRPRRSAPGDEFQYNSGAAAMLGMALEKAIGRSLQDYAQERLFSPLGVRPWYWQRLPGGTPNGAGGLYMSVDELARLGLLVARGGRWKDGRMLPESWLARSTSSLSDSARSVGGPYGYGLLWWRAEADGFYALGFGGQYLLVYPRADLVIVTTGGLFGPDYRYPETILARGILAALGRRPAPRNEPALSSSLEAFRSGPPASSGQPSELSGFIGQARALRFEDGSAIRLGPPSEGAIPLDWTVNGNRVQASLPRDGSYVAVELGSFGGLPRNAGWLSLARLDANGLELILRRRGVPYAYRYELRLEDGSPTWTGYVSYRRDPIERYAGVYVAP